MRKWLKQLFCKHKYSIAGKLLYKGFTTYFMECMICGKRHVVKDGAISYAGQTKKLINMWIKKEIEINFDKEEKNEG